MIVYEPRKNAAGMSVGLTLTVIKSKVSIKFR